MSRILAALLSIALAIQSAHAAPIVIDKETIENPDNVLRVAKGKSIIGKVVRVLDGDTIDVQRGKTVYRVRLAEIDAPEKKQPYGAESTARLQAKLSAYPNVRVIWTKRELHGRILGTVYTIDELRPDAWSINVEQIVMGCAWVYRAYPHAKVCEKMEADARDARKGLWNADNPEPPWSYRKRIKAEAAAKKERRTNDRQRSWVQSPNLETANHACHEAPRCLPCLRNAGDSCLSRHARANRSCDCHRSGCKCRHAKKAGRCARAEHRKP